MYEHNLPVPIGVGLSLFSTKNVYIFDFNGANICVNWFGFFFKSTSTCFIYFDNVEKFTKTDAVKVSLLWVYYPKTGEITSLLLCY